MGLMSITHVRSAEDSHVPSPTDCQALVPFHGDPAFSQLSNLMLKAIRGNSDVQHAQVICIGDYHNDPSQRYIRAQMINELVNTAVRPRKIHFLIEGVGGTPDEQDMIDRMHEVYERMIGKGFVRHPHSVSGWDNDTLVELQYCLIRKIQALGRQYKACQEQGRNTSQRLSGKTSKLEKALLLKELSIVDSQATLLLGELGEAIQASESVIRARDYSLFQSVRKVSQENPDSLVIVLAGDGHFRFVAQAIDDLKYCVLETRPVPLQVKGFQLLDALYGRHESQQTPAF